MIKMALLREEIWSFLQGKSQTLFYIQQLIS